MRTILITNANTFKGYNLCLKAIELGYKVYAINEKNFTHKITYNNANIIVLRDSLIESDGLSDTFKHLKSKLININTVIHVSCELFSYYTKNLNTIQTDNLISAFEKADYFPNKFVFSSSIIAQGPLSKIEYQSGKKPPGPITSYGSELDTLEKKIKEHEKLQHLIFRSPFIYGPHDHKIEDLIRFITNNLAFYISSFNSNFAVLYIKDYVNVLFKTIESTIVNKSYPISDGDQHMLESFYFYLNQALNKKSISISLPFPILKLLAKLAGNKASSILSKSKVEMKNNWYCGIKELKSDIGYKPEYNLQRGIADTIKWYRENDWL